MTSVPSRNPVSQIGDAAVDDDAGIENAIPFDRTDVAEEAGQPLRLEPLPLARPHDDAEVGEDEQHEAVEEADAVVAGVDEEERRADRLGQAQSDGAADERPEQIGDLRLPELRLDEDDGGAEQRADADVGQERRVERPEDRRGPRNGGDEERAHEQLPRHEQTPKINVPPG